MPQVIKHRRGSIGSLKDATTNNAELVVASGSIGDLNGPFSFIGSPTPVDQGTTGAYRPISKIYSGATAPTIVGSAYGTVLNGTPYYSTTDQVLYILNDNVIGGGNDNIDLTGNIEGNHIASVTIDELNGDVSLVGDLTASGDFWLKGSALIDGNITLDGNLTLLGDTTEVNISSSTVNIDDNLIRLNAYSPFERYAGIEVIDSGSSETSASLQWDSLNDYWLLQNSNGTSGQIVSVATASLGSEIDLTTNTIPKANSGNTIGDSLLIDTGTELSYATDAITIQQSSGNTEIKGIVTLTNSGGTDANGDTSTLVYRNSSNQIGYVASTDTEAVMDQIIGYRTSDGSLIASSVIDGGGF